MNSQFVLIASDDHVDARSLEQAILSFGCRVATIPREHMTSAKVNNLHPSLLILDLDRRESSPDEGLSWQETLCAQSCRVLAMSTSAMAAPPLMNNIEYLQKPIDVAYVRHCLNQSQGPHWSAKQGGCQDADALTEVRTVIQERCGLDLAWRQCNSFERVLRQRMEALGITKHVDYMMLLMSGTPDGEELSRLIDQLTVGETSFFRYGAHDQALIDVVLPEIIQRNRRERRLRIWSAGCATGEEPYTMALLLRKHFPQLLDWDVRIQATDINRQFLRLAHTGRYSARRMHTVPQELRDEYFTPGEDGDILSASIRQMVNFDYCNLKTSPFPSRDRSFTGFDIILCRNVLIYFDDVSRKTVLDRLIDCLHPQGYMFFGHTEFMQNVSNRLGTVRSDRAFFYRAKPIGETTAVPQAAASTPAITAAASNRAADPAPAGRKQAAPPCQPAPAESKGHQDCPSIFQKAINDFNRGEFSLALEHFAQILGQDPGHAGALTGKGLIAVLHGDYALGWDCSSQVVARDDLFADAYLLRGLILERQGQLEESMREYQKVLWLEPDFVAAHYLLSKVLSRLDRLRDAQRSLKNTLRLVQQQNNQTMLRYFGGLAPQGLADCFQLLSRPRQFCAA